MYILKNAWISIIRNKSRNLLIGAIILVIAGACTVTLAINNTASDLINSYDSAYQKELTISFNREAMMQDMDFSDREAMRDRMNDFNNIANYTVSDIEKFGDSKHIESYYYTYSFALNGNDIEKATMDDNTSNREFGGMQRNTMDFTITGYSSIDSMSEFINGTYTMSEITSDAWDKAFDGDYVFINEELAIYNELELGDTIKLEDEDGENIYEFEIIGIFKDNDTENSSMMNMFSNSVNTIVTNSSVLRTIDDENDSINGSVTPTFIIDSYDNAIVIQNEFYEKGLDENYTVQTNQEMAEAGLASVKNVKSFATTFLVITLLIGGVVLFILNMINIRERKYEIGVLRTIGLSKIKLTLQFVSELLIVAVVALLVGAGVGATMSKGVSNSLLSNEIENSQNSVEEMRNNFGGGRGNGGNMNIPNFRGQTGVPTVQAYESIDAVVNITVVLQLLGIGLVLVLISSIASMISIQRFSPLTILKERS